MADWSQLPTELLELISCRLETSFEIIHFRSTCSSWRSVVPPPDNFRCLGIKTPNIPFTFNGEPPLEKDDYCTLKKIPVFLLRFNKTSFESDYVLSEIRERKLGKSMLMSSPLMCDGITYRRGEKMFFNSLTTQIISFGDYYEITYYEKKFNYHFGEHCEKTSERVEFLKLDGEDCKDFVVLSGINRYQMLMFTSRNMCWTRIVGLPETYHWFQGMVSFKGKFFVVDSSGWGQVFAIQLSLEVTEIPSVGGSHKSDQESLVKSGEDLLLVQRFIPVNHDDYMYTWFKVFRLDEEEGRMTWVQVNDLNDRVIFLGHRWNLCCSVQKLPGTKENCIVFIDSTDGIISDNESILMFDLRTRRTSTVFSECRGCMGAFCLNLEYLVSCGVVTLPNEATSAS